MTSYTPTAASAMIDFADLAAQAAAGPNVLAYLKARGIDRTATLALIASAEDVFIRAVADPFVNGHAVGGTTHKAKDGEGDIARAILLHMWMEAKRQWQAHVALPTPSPPTPATTTRTSTTPFDGVGAPHHIIQQLFGTPLLSISWEIDRACCKVMNARTPWVVQRGEDAQSVVDLILARRILTAKPSSKPCQDFSHITDGPGNEGERGGLFLTTVEDLPRQECSASSTRTSSCNPRWPTKSPTPWPSSPSLFVHPTPHGSIGQDCGGRQWIGVPIPTTHTTTDHYNGPNTASVVTPTPQNGAQSGLRIPAGRRVGTTVHAHGNHAGHGRQRTPCAQVSQRQDPTGRPGSVAGTLQAVCPLALPKGGHAGRHWTSAHPPSQIEGAAPRHPR